MGEWPFSVTPSPAPWHATERRDTAMNETQRSAWKDDPLVAKQLREYGDALPADQVCEICYHLPATGLVAVVHHERCCPGRIPDTRLGWPVTLVPVCDDCEPFAARMIDRAIHAAAGVPYPGESPS